MYSVKVSSFQNSGRSGAVNSDYELIRYNDRLPARIEIMQGKCDVRNHWHKEIELVYVLKGELKITVNSKSCFIGEDSFRLINSVENHRLYAENAKCMILDISYEFAKRYEPLLYNSVFKISGRSGAEEEIRNLLWQLSRTVNGSELSSLLQYSIITEILHTLLVQCRHENPTISKESEPVQSRHAKLAVEYIEQHYREDVSLVTVAEHLGIQPEYLSFRFKEAMGITFSKYVLEFRLERAMDALMNKNMSIEDAAAAGGFPSKRTFIAKCKQAYNATPFKLLKQRKDAT